MSETLLRRDPASRIAPGRGPWSGGPDRDLAVPDRSAYLSFYRLRSVPFRASAGPEHLWLGGMHRQILETLTAALRQGGGVALLTGDVGTGKTSLVNGLVGRLRDDSTIVARLPGLGLDAPDFLAAVAAACHMPATRGATGGFAADFAEFLREAGASHRTVALIVDEAQSLRPDVLREIRDLSELAPARAGALGILLVGHSELGAILAHERHAELRRRITTRCTVEPLTPAEVGAYIRHCLAIAGTRDEVFSAEAITDIAALSRGAPAAINARCEQALLTGYRRKVRTIGVAIVRESLEAGQPRRHSRAGVSLLHGRGRPGRSPIRARRLPAGLASPRTYGAVLLAAIVLGAGAYSLHAGWFSRAHDPAIRSTAVEPPAAPPAGTVAPAPPAPLPAPPTALDVAATRSAPPAAPGPGPAIARPAPTTAVAPKREPRPRADAAVSSSGAPRGTSPPQAAAPAPDEPARAVRPVARPAPVATSVPPATPASPAATAPIAAPPAPAPPAAPAPIARPAPPASAGKDADAPDPSSVIDWLLKERGPGTR